MPKHRAHLWFKYLSRRDRAACICKCSTEEFLPFPLTNDRSSGWYSSSREILWVRPHGRGSTNRNKFSVCHSDPKEVHLRVRRSVRPTSDPPHVVIRAVHSSNCKICVRGHVIQSDYQAMQILSLSYTSGMSRPRRFQVQQFHQKGSILNGMMIYSPRGLYTAKA